MTPATNLPTGADLVPETLGTKIDHGPYIAAVVKALQVVGLRVEPGRWEARWPGSRSAYIDLPDVGDGVERRQLGWDESCGWTLNCSHGDSSDWFGLTKIAGPLTPPRKLVALIVTALAEEDEDTNLDAFLAGYLPPVEEEDPSPADCRQIALSLMLNAARQLNDIREDLPGLLGELGITLAEDEFEALINEASKLAETADITIGWTEVSE